jgi:hypothetical protein
VTVQPGQDIQKRTARRGYSGHNSMDRSACTILPVRSPWTGQPKKDRWGKSTGRGQLGQISLKRSAGTVQPANGSLDRFSGQVSLDRSFWMDEPGQDRGGKPEGTGQPGQDIRKRTAWTGYSGHISLDRSACTVRPDRSP